jgi:hypothetical protein
LFEASLLSRKIAGVFSSKIRAGVAIGAAALKLALQIAIFALELALEGQNVGAALLTFIQNLLTDIGEIAIGFSEIVPNDITIAIGVVLGFVGNLVNLIRTIIAFDGKLEFHLYGTGAASKSVASAGEDGQRAFGILGPAQATAG